MRWELRERSKPPFAYSRFENSFILRISTLWSRNRAGDSKSSQMLLVERRSDLRFLIQSGLVERMPRLSSSAYEGFRSGNRGGHSFRSKRAVNVEPALSRESGAAENDGEPSR